MDSSIDPHGGFPHFSAISDLNSNELSSFVSFSWVEQLSVARIILSQTFQFIGDIIIFVVSVIIESSPPILKVGSLFLFKSEFQVIDHKRIFDSDAVQESFEFFGLFSRNMNIHILSDSRWLSPHIQSLTSLQIFDQGTQLSIGLGNNTVHLVTIEWLFLSSKNCDSEEGDEFDRQHFECSSLTTHS